MAAHRTDSTQQTARSNLRKQQQPPPMFLALKCTSPKTVSLIDTISESPMYKIHDTGRGSFSLTKKPDYEIFRCTSDDLLVGSICLGKRGTDIKLPLTNQKYDDAEAFVLRGRKLKWKTNYISRRPTQGAGVDRFSFEIDVQTESWIVDLECVDETTDEVYAAVRLFDSVPNGRIEIRMKDACVGVGVGVDNGGDWDLLDELVTMAYANMEMARRRVLGAPDPTHTVGIGGIGIVTAIGMGGGGC